MEKWSISWLFFDGSSNFLCLKISKLIVEQLLFYACFHFEQILLNKILLWKSWFFQFSFENSKQNTDIFFTKSTVRFTSMNLKSFIRLTWSCWKPSVMSVFCSLLPTASNVFFQFVSFLHSSLAEFITFFSFGQKARFHSRSLHKKDIVVFQSTQLSRSNETAFIQSRPCRFAQSLWKRMFVY